MGITGYGGDDVSGQVDLWTETSEEEEYAELSKLIAEGITTEADNTTDAKALIAAAETEDKFPEESATTTTTRYRREKRRS